MSDNQSFGQSHRQEHAISLFRNGSFTPFRFAARLIFAMLALLPQACGPRDARFNPSHFQPQGYLVPPDMSFSRPVRSAIRTGGVFVESAENGAADVCCWIGPHAAFLVKKTSAASHLQVSAYIAEIARFREHPQQITVTFVDVKKRVRWRNMKTGFNTILIPVPPELRNVRGKIRIVMDAAYYDAPPGPRSNATPLYAALISSIYFE